MDVRYNVIQWVHRSTRGWSYGNSLVDPRTGEIIQGRVTLGSLRDRQDFLIAEGLLAPYEKANTASPKLLEMVLARLRQLSAHEVGHTLGLQHNYAASPVNRASVMDYPAPRANVGADGVPDLSDAYAKGIGEWDKVAIAYGYQDFAPGTDEQSALDRTLSDGVRARADVLDRSGCATGEQFEFGCPSLGQRHERDRRTEQCDEGARRCAASIW